MPQLIVFVVPRTRRTAETRHEARPCLVISRRASEALHDGPHRRRELLLGHGRELPREQNEPRGAL